MLDFAAVDASNNVIPLPAYDLNDFTAATKNTKVNGVSSLAADMTINSPSTATVRGLTLAVRRPGKLTITSGGIISNQATQTIEYPVQDFNCECGGFGQWHREYDIEYGRRCFSGCHHIRHEGIAVTTASNFQNHRHHRRRNGRAH